jgi:hypothetical protein
LAQIRSVKLSDGEGQQRLVMALQMAQAVNRQLWHLIQDGHEATESIRVRGSRID